jgi:hypothetical protein
LFSSSLLGMKVGVLEVLMFRPAVCSHSIATG